MGRGFVITAVRGFDDVRYFIHDTRINDFTRTTQHLDLAPTTINGDITGLRTHLNIQLFRHDAHDLALARTNRLFLDRIDTDLCAVRGTITGLTDTRKQPTNALGMDVNAIFKHLCIIPLLNRFLQHFPTVGPS